MNDATFGQTSATASRGRAALKATDTEPDGAAFIMAAVYQEEIMHVHADYSLQLTSLGASRREVQEIANRRLAEVRRKLSPAAGRMSDVGDGVSAVPIWAEQPEQQDEQGDAESDTFGRLLSVRA